MADTIRIEIDKRGVARLTLVRPEKHNAMSAQMIDELAETALRLGGGRSISSSCFVSGLDSC